MTRLARIAVVMGLWLAWCGAASARAEYPDPVEQRAQFDHQQTYFLHLPAGYTRAKRWPLFIAIHGTYASGIGDFTMWRPYADQEGFILLAPNLTAAPEFERFPTGEDAKLLHLIREVDEAYGVDLQKIMLTGFSRGGVFVCRFVFAHPSVAHTAVVFNGAPYFPQVPPSHEPPRTRFYLSAGTGEPEVERLARSMARALEAHGYQVTLYVARGRGHSIAPQAVLDALRLFRAMNAPTGH